MRSLSLVLLPIGLVVVLSSLAAAQPAESQTDLGANAALQYWQAFSHLPASDAAQEKVLSEWATISLDDPAVKKLLAGSHTSLMYLRRGAKMQRCDWGL